MPRRDAVPKYRHHKARNLALVHLNGRDHYLGPYNSPESRAEYNRLVAQWLTGGRSLPIQPSERPGLLMVELIAAYWRYAEGHYRHEGKPSRELVNIRHALAPVKSLFGHKPASEFGPAAYKTVRAEMIRTGLCRTTIQNRLGKIRRLIRWAVAEELVPADTLHRIQAVPGLRPGREGVRERPPVQALADDQIEPVLPHLPPPIRAMVELQRLTGMRPGEVTAMTMGAIDRSGELWIYRPAHHKTAVYGKERRILLGPKAQELLAPWLKADPDAALFSPRDWMARRQAERRAARKTPMTPSQRARRPKARPKREPGERYDRVSYGQAIARACRKAGVPSWGPNRLRHSVATRIRREFGLEAAQVVLGHSRADVTQIYAEADTAQAVEVMRRIG